MNSLKENKEFLTTFYDSCQKKEFDKILTLFSDILTDNTPHKHTAEDNLDELFNQVSGGVFKCLYDEELRLTLERYHIFLNQTNDVIFEWDMPHQHFEVTNTWRRKFGHPGVDSLEEFARVFTDTENSLVNPGDVEVIQSCHRDIVSRTPYIEKTLRLLDASNRYIWCKLRLTQQFAPDGSPLKIIGVITDINQEMKKSQKLKRRAEQDALTGMYNKFTTHNLIRNYLLEKPEKPCALLIIDIDNFKTINDTLGHLYGDAILSELSRSMRNSFRESDILGRVGGDEFIVFLKDIKNSEDAQKSAAKVLPLFSQLRNKDNLDASISCSIGISMYPNDGRDFSSLYQNADQALYQAKQEGKNRYSLYDANTSTYLDLQKKRQGPLTAKSDANSPDSWQNEDILQYIFKVLYNTKDLNHAITSILEIIGTHYDVSRVYIFENNFDNLYCRNTFEWCNKGIQSQRDRLQHLSYEDDLGGSFYDNFNEENIFYCPDVNELNGAQRNIISSLNVKSLLQCGIIDKGEFRGFVGFEECLQHRLWTQNQIDLLVFISEILSTFLLKWRATECSCQENKALLSILDNQSSWIYVVDSDTGKILFLNKKAESSDPSFGDWGSVETSHLLWKGIDAILITFYAVP